MGIQKSKFRKECVFQYWKEKSRGLLKDTKELFTEAEEIGDVCCALMDHKIEDKICIRGICPLYQIMLSLKSNLVKAEEKD